MTLLGQAQNQEVAVPSLELWFGMENRITPIYTNTKNAQIIVDYSTPVNIDKQLAGTAISIGVAYKIPKLDSYFSFEYAFRYDHLYYDVSMNSVLSQSVTGVISDYHFRLNRPLRTGNIKLIPGIGYSLMNHGTDYRENSSGSWKENDYQFNCFDLSFGIGVDRFDLEFRTYLVSENRYKWETGFIILPEIKLKYSLPVL
jgi:hypothetical protein